MKKLYSGLVILLFASLVMVNAQTIERQVIAYGGGYYEGETFSVSYTIGESVVTTEAGDGIIITQGFQQPGEATVRVDFEQSVNWEVAVYPNPVRDRLHVQIIQEEEQDIIVETFDILGQRINSVRKEGNSNRKIDLVLNFSEMAAGIYLVKVMTADEKQVKTYKINKIN